MSSCPHVVIPRLLQSDLRDLYRGRIVYKSRNFTIRMTNKDHEHLRVVFSFARKTGNAVVRNRYKRRLREVLRGILGGHASVDLMCFASGLLTRLTREDWNHEKHKMAESILRTTRRTGAD